jgi:hypothetical protein
VPGRDKKVVPAAMDEAALEACHYATAEKWSGSQWERQLSSQVHMPSITPAALLTLSNFGERRPDIFRTERLE